MRSVFQTHVIVVVVAAAVGVVVGSQFIEPAILGALLGLGAGLGGGAFIAAVVTGTSLAGGGARSVGPADIWGDEDLPDEQPDGDPPRANGRSH